MDRLKPQSQLEALLANRTAQSPVSAISPSSGIAHELLQYPDVRVYNAAAKLKPEDRPDVPVRIAGKEFFGRGILSNFQFEGAAGDNKILVNKNGRAYGDKNDPYKLAGTLAHEQQHIRNYRKDPMDYSETSAYIRQHDALKRAGYKDGAYLRALLERARTDKPVGTSGKK